MKTFGYILFLLFGTLFTVLHQNQPPVNKILENVSDQSKREADFAKMQAENKISEQEYHTEVAALTQERQRQTIKTIKHRNTNGFSRKTDR